MLIVPPNGPPTFNIAGCLGGLTAGVIGQVLHDAQWSPPWGFKTFTFYDVLFVLSGALRLAAAILFLPFLHEPAAGRTLDAVRFVSASIYNNVFNAVLQPVRLLRRETPLRVGPPIKLPAKAPTPAAARRAA